MKKKSWWLVKILSPIAVAGGCLSIIPFTTSCSFMYHDLKHIAPYLHEIVYDDYREDVKYETIDDSEAFGCSSVRLGNYYGRNFDYVYNDTPEFVVRVKANKQLHRHESIAIATHFGLREKKLLNGQYHKQLELVPNLTMDGINDAGVICSSNVVSMEPNKEVLTAETKPGEGKKKLHALFIPRYVLDNASSAEDAVNKLTNDVNIFGNLKKEMNLHIMIADKTKTYVVEFFKKKDSNHNHFDVVAEEKSDNWNNPTSIMTNHYLNTDQATFTNEEKFGNERLELLKKHYPQTQDQYNNFGFDDMVALMRNVQFSKAYRIHTDPSEKATSQIPMGKTGYDLELSEWYSEKVKQKDIATWEESKTPSQQSDFWQDLFVGFDQLKEDFAEKVREEANPSYWITTHNTTYHWDWEKNEGLLSVIVQEQYEHHYDYHIKINAN
ncbi:MAG: carcinine hydrolase/isopenicillin-N N-acyltransferase family protein [Mycoplasmoidaceae bacterium]